MNSGEFLFWGEILSNEQTHRVLAQNENGEDSASILVTVTAPPSPPGQPVVIDITGTTCVLRYLRFSTLKKTNQSLHRWEPVQDDGGTDVKHYIVEYFRYSSGSHVL